MDGEMQFETSTSQTYKGERGEKGIATRYSDNLKLEGNGCVFVSLFGCVCVLVSVFACMCMCVCVYVRVCVYS